MFTDLLNPEDDRETVVVLSGGGARGIWQWTVLMELAKRFKISMVCGTSAGTLNAYAFSKGLFDYTSHLYAEVYSQNAVQITKPGLAKLENGRLRPDVDTIKKVLLKGINVFDLPKLLFKSGQKKVLDQLLQNFLGAPALMDNAPLFETVGKLQKLNPGFDIPCLINVVDMKTGQPLSVDVAEFAGDLEKERRYVVASTTIPILWPLVLGHLGDGGMREGTPVNAIWTRLDPNKKYRIIAVMCSKETMQDSADLSNPLKIGGQAFSIMMNEAVLNDLARLEDRNEEARKYGEAPGRRLVPLEKIIYSGYRDPLDFSHESYVEQIGDGFKDVGKFFNDFNKAA
ncbi:patatin-like phospholipase family protein [Dyadobacter sp. Leaf189]|uniref:patatin-like phospholipase family protein n=1 Tax=Dyadobacter sp. Leaf189 TaxID=1736295 RepID=UPI0006F69D41|nr:patatin-like phospholipase family protein [Dyadobacter sp. Leaf189]KQS33983.1 hypothetical protein ASG33_08100 [Dyadobacter sp. Leaf189]